VKLKVKNKTSKKFKKGISLVFTPVDLHCFTLFNSQYCSNPTIKQQIEILVRLVSAVNLSIISWFCMWWRPRWPMGHMGHGSRAQWVTWVMGHSEWPIPCSGLEGKRENYQLCSVQYCAPQLCTVQCTHIWTDLTVLWNGFCLTGSISLCLDSFLYTYYSIHV